MARTKVFYGYIENDGLVFVNAEDADEITRLGVRPLERHHLERVCNRPQGVDEPASPKEHPTLLFRRQHYVSGGDSTAAGGNISESSDDGADSVCVGPGAACQVR